MSRWLEGLNPEQKQAALHDRGPLLILAGAGSGKTTVLVSRAGRLIDEGVVSADRLCVLTFTNKAARELKQRVGRKLGSAGDAIWAGTFHSFGLQILKRYHKAAGLPRHFGIMDGGDATALVKEIMRNFNLAGKDAFDADKLLEMMSRWRENGQREAKKDEEYEIALEWLLPKYEKKLEMLGMVDFDTLILKPLQLLKENPDVRAGIQGTYDQVMVDEFQDTNLMQMRLVRELVKSHRNIAVVGDDDQSIYGWRGACVSNILDFPKLYSGCKVVRLERNYRSTRSILTLANAVISNNKKRHPKVLRPESGEEGMLPEMFVYEHEAEEVETVASEISLFRQDGYRHRDIAVLYRSNSQGAMLEAELRRQGIPYVITGGTAFFDRKEVRDVMAYLRCSFAPNDVALRRILNTPARGIGDKSIETLNRFAIQSNCSFVAASRKWQAAGLDPKAGAAIDKLWGTLKGFLPSLTDGPSTGQQLLIKLTELGYRGHLEKHSKDGMAFQKRWRMMEVFGTILERFTDQGGRNVKALREAMEAMELRDNGDQDDEEKDEVQLLTLHACKGLEWPAVILMGVEEDLLPHRTLGGDISEERRLFYVGITRARERLILTRTKKRKKHGKWASCPPSRFLLELPKGLIQRHEGMRPVRESRRKSLVADLFKKLDALDAQPSS